MGDPILCIDVGTSSMKGGLFTEDGQVLQLVRVPLADPSTENFSTFEPHRWEDALRSILSRLNGVLPKGIVFSGQGPTLVPIDEKGNPTFYALLWLDQREVPLTESNSLFLSKVLWLRKEQPQAFDRTFRFLSCPEYLIYKITGEAVTVSPTSEFDSYYWDHETLEQAGLRPAAFPPFVRPATIVGRASPLGADAFGLSTQTKIYAGGPDYLMSLLGTATTKLNTTCDRAGTSEGVNVCIASPVNRKDLRCLPHLIPGLYTLAGMLTSSGRLFEWFRDLTNQRTDSYEEMMGGILARLPRVLQKPSSFPFFYPFPQPRCGWDFTQGIFVGFGTEHDKADLGFAVVEAIGYAVRSTIESLELAGFSIESLRLSGGQANNRIWNQMKADIVGKPLWVPRVKDAELMGEFIVYTLAEGIETGFDQAAQNYVQFERLMEPTPEIGEVYRERYTLYKEQGKRLMALF